MLGNLPWSSTGAFSLPRANLRAYPNYTSPIAAGPALSQLPSQCSVHLFSGVLLTAYGQARCRRARSRSCQSTPIHPLLRRIADRDHALFYAYGRLLRSMVVGRAQHARVCEGCPVRPIWRTLDRRRRAASHDGCRCYASDLEMVDTCLPSTTSNALVSPRQTPEPSPAGIDWHITRDVTVYGSFLASGEPMNATLSIPNVVDSTYTGALSISVSLSFEPATCDLRGPRCASSGFVQKPYHPVGPLA